jgi:hypothetical protein
MSNKEKSFSDTESSEQKVFLKKTIDKQTDL